MLGDGEAVELRSNADVGVDAVAEALEHVFLPGEPVDYPALALGLVGRCKKAAVRRSKCFS